MTKQAKDLTAGDIIRVEFGDYGNFAKFTIDEIHRTEENLTVKCSRSLGTERFPMEFEEKIEVIGHIEPENSQWMGTDHDEGRN